MIDKAEWIKSPRNDTERCYEFYLPINIGTGKKVNKAVLSVSAIGLYRAFIGGKCIGNEVLTPYFTEYSHRVQYQSYDVSELTSENFELSFICAEGWAVGRLWGSKIYGKNISLIFSLDLTFDDGTTAVIVSDENVRVRTSHIISSSIYDGEYVDMTAKRCELGNAEKDFDVKTTLIPQEGEKVVEQEIISPQRLIITSRGEKVLDFGQNLAGYVQVTVNSAAGSVIELSHAEVLDNKGNFYTANLRQAKQINTYITSGNGAEVFKPMFTWQGFRYVRIDKFPCEEIKLEWFKAIVIHSDMKPRNTFICGNAEINQLYHNIVWGQKSNFIDIPTDCPQRDERMGWLGDAQVFVRTAAINYDTERFFAKWLHDLALGQRYDGGVYSTVPTLNADRNSTDVKGVSAGWGDAAVISPWEIYKAYGNTKILESQFESMKKWVDYIHNAGDNEFLWLGGEHYGDWLAADGEVGSYEGATPKDYIASAYFAYSTELLIKAGRVLGRDMSGYERLYDGIVAAFRKAFTENGVPTARTQTAFALALCFNLCSDRVKTAAELNRLVRGNGTKITTGFIGTPYILYALSDNGYTDTAYDLLFRHEPPSWLYQVKRGATTMWEHWDGIKTDGTFWDDDMNSYNHYAYGAVYSWIFETAAGIRNSECGVGYGDIIIKPCPDKRMEFLRTKLDTKYGVLSCYWYYTVDGDIRFEFDIPDGVRARIVLPNGIDEAVSGGKYHYSMSI